MSSHSRAPDVRLAQQLADSRRYWESDGSAGAPLVLPGSDLSRLDLREQVLAGAQLQGADLRGALLDSAVLVRAALDGARLGGASLYLADASKATLVEAELAGAQAPRSRWTRATLTRADMSASRFDDADFTGAELIGVRLDGASLLRAAFLEAVLLGASLRDAQIESASFEKAALDPGALTRAVGSPLGSPSVELSSTPRRRLGREVDFEAKVRSALQERKQRVMWGFAPGPDFVIDLGGAFAALEVSASADPDRLFRLARQADLIVVPEDLDVRSAMDGTPVERLSRLGVAINALDPSQIKPFGAVAVAVREADRLRPYYVLGELSQTDPTSLSRISSYLDSRQEFLLNSSDRKVARGLPAHLDGAMAGRGARWAVDHYEKLKELLHVASAMRRGETSEREHAHRWARRGLQLEQELADHVRPRP
jgi:hypothetical protein